MATEHNLLSNMSLGKCYHADTDQLLSMGTCTLLVQSMKRTACPSVKSHRILRITLINPNLYPTVLDLTCLTKIDFRNF